MRVGFHVPTAGGWAKALRRALERRCETVQAFMGAPVQWNCYAPSAEEAAAWRFGLQKCDIWPFFVHASYLLNLASPDAGLWRRSIRRLGFELTHAGILGAQAVVTHLGSSRGVECNASWRAARVARAIDDALESAESSLHLLLENSAGMGDSVGSKYAELGDILAKSRYPERLGICLDSAHSFAAGYAWHVPDGLDAALDEADRTFGLNRVALLHINDSKTPLGSCVDRHWHIGKGYIGMPGFRVIVNHVRLRHLPMIMETPEASLKADLRNLRALRRCIEPAFRLPLRSCPR